MNLGFNEPLVHVVEFEFLVFTEQRHLFLYTPHFKQVFSSRGGNTPPLEVFCGYAGRLYPMGKSLYPGVGSFSLSGQDNCGSSRVTLDKINKPLYQN
jgi:hypothetical protein